MNTLKTFDSIKEDLIQLGIKKGDTVFLRISYRAIGKTEGGPKTFLDAILDIVGEDGTVLLTAFPKRYKRRLRFFHRRDYVQKDPRPQSITGALSNISMHYPGAMLSSRVDFPFVAIGKHAQYLTSNHTYEKEGYWILEEAIEKFDCICLRIGGEPFIGTTHMAVSHILREKGEYQMAPRYGVYVKDNNSIEWKENNNVVFCKNAFKAYLPAIFESIRIIEGKVGDGYAIITDMKESLKAEEDLLRKDLHNILCSDPDCCICRTSFSFSDSSKWFFLLKQFLNLFRGNVKVRLSKIKYMLETFLLFRDKNN